MAQAGYGSHSDTLSKTAAQTFGMAHLAERCLGFSIAPLDGDAFETLPCLGLQSPPTQKVSLVAPYFSAGRNLEALP